MGLQGGGAETAERTDREIEVVVRSEPLLDGTHQALIGGDHHPSRHGDQPPAFRGGQDRCDLVAIAPEMTAVIGDAIMRIGVDQPIDEAVFVEGNGVTVDRNREGSCAHKQTFLVRPRAAPGRDGRAVCGLGPTEFETDLSRCL